MEDQLKEYKNGYTNFANCKIDLSMKPMIPRKETEFWVKKAIKKLSRKTGSRFAGKIDVLDIFSGSGCIGIAILRACPEINRGIFAEIDKKFIRQIKINLKLNKINPTCPERSRGKRYRVIQSDIFKNIKGEFDYIFANPPYIPLKNKHLVQKSVLDFEPHLALFGGEDGLLYIRKFLKHARKYLKPNGKIYLEFDYLQKRELEKLLKKLNYKNFQFHKDQFKKWRYVVVRT